MFDKIILSGGSTRGYYQLGCLYKHEDDIKDVKKYVGTSVGGLICLMLSCGYTILDIFKLSLNAKCKLPEGKELIKAAHNFVMEGGILKENPYIVELENVIHKKYGYIPTMKQLYDITKKELTLVSACVTNHSVMYIDYKSHPDMLCTVAANMSARIPILFTPILYEGHLYVDGGLCDHFPIYKAEENERVLAIYLNTNTIGEIKSVEHMGLFQYVNSLIETGLKTRYINMNIKDNILLYEICADGPGINSSPTHAFFMFIIGCLTKPYNKNNKK